MTNIIYLLRDEDGDEIEFKPIDQVGSGFEFVSPDMDRFYVELFRTADIIGQGAFGSVQKVQYRFSQKPLPALVTKSGIIPASALTGIKTELSYFRLIYGGPTTLYYSARDITTYDYTILMKELPGKSLFSYLQRVQLNSSERLKILLAVLKALKVFHARNLIHGDLKPTNMNIYRNEMGEYTIYFLDFYHTRPISEKAYSISPEDEDCTYWTRDRTGEASPPSHPYHDIYSLFYYLAVFCKGFNYDFILQALPPDFRESISLQLLVQKQKELEAAYNETAPELRSLEQSQAIFTLLEEYQQLEIRYKKRMADEKFLLESVSLEALVVSAETKFLYEYVINSFGLYCGKDSPTAIKELMLSDHPSMNDRINALPITFFTQLYDELAHLSLELTRFFLADENISIVTEPIEAIKTELYKYPMFCEIVDSLSSDMITELKKLASPTHGLKAHLTHFCLHTGFNTLCLALTSPQLKEKLAELFPTEAGNFVALHEEFFNHLFESISLKTSFKNYLITKNNDIPDKQMLFTLLLSKLVTQADVNVFIHSTHYIPPEEFIVTSCPDIFNYLSPKFIKEIIVERLKATPGFDVFVPRFRRQSSEAMTLELEKLLPFLALESTDEETNYAMTTLNSSITSLMTATESSDSKRKIMVVLISLYKLSLISVSLVNPGGKFNFSVASPAELCTTIIAHINVPQPASRTTGFFSAASPLDGLNRAFIAQLDSLQTINLPRSVIRTLIALYFSTYQGTLRREIPDAYNHLFATKSTLLPPSPGLARAG